MLLQISRSNIRKDRSQVKHHIPVLFGLFVFPEMELFFLTLKQHFWCCA